MGWARPPRFGDRYEVIAEIGHGSMGVVYDVLDTRTARRVALKTLREPDADALYRLKKEFRALADLSHPNLVELYDLVVDGDQCFFTMELVVGVDFIGHCRPPRRRHRPTAYDLDALRSALAQLAAGLDALHRAAKVHRDIKPSNVLVRDDGRVVLLDLGLVADRAAGKYESLDGKIVGTLAYMSPEQAMATEVGPASDWYSVGVLLYEALTGALPLDGEPVQILTGKLSGPAPAPRDAVPSVPHELDALCRRLLAVDPAARAGAADVLAVVGEDPDRTPGEIARTTDLSRVVPFTGRGAELAVLEAAVASARGRRAVVAHVTGPSGIGKSALVGELLERIAAHHPGAVLLRGRCFESEFVPFKAIDGLIDGLSAYWRRLSHVDAMALLPRAASTLPRVFPVLGRVPAVAEAPLLADRSDPVESRARAFGALREVLQRLADRELTVLFLDDLQWVDADTVALLADLLRPPEAPAVVWVLSARSGADALTAIERVLEGAGEVVRLEVGPLPVGDALALARELVPELDPALTDVVVRESGGSPFFLGELVRYLQGAPAGATQLELGEVLRRRIEALPSHAVRLLEAVAIAGEPLPIADAGAAVGIGAGTLMPMIRLLRVHHFLRTSNARGSELEVYHDRIREAVLAQMAPEQRRRVHRGLAMALEGRAATPRLARHWAGAGDHARAAHYAARGGDEALASFDFDQAAALYRSALELGSQPTGERRALQQALGHALRSAGRSAEAAEAFLAAADGADPVTRLALRRAAAAQLLSAGFIDRGRGILDDVLADLGERMPATQRRTVLALVGASWQLRMRGLGWIERSEAEIPPRDLQRLDCYLAIGLCLGIVDTLRAAVFQARGLVLALAAGEPTRIFQFLVLNSVFLISSGRAGLRRAARLMAEADRVGEQAATPFHRAWLDVMHGFHHYFLGQYRDAIGRLERAERTLLAETEGTAVELDNARIFQVMALRFRGGCRALKEKFDVYLADARHRGDEFLKTTLLRACNIVWLVADDVAGARAALDDSWWSPPESGYHLQHWYLLRARGEIALYGGGGDWDELAAGIDRFDGALAHRVQKTRADSLWLRGRLGLARPGGRWDPVEVARSLDRERIAYASVWAACLRAGAALGDGADRAESLLRDALAAAEAHDLPLYGQVVRWRLGRLVGGVAGASLVDEAERWMTDEGIAVPARFVGLILPRPEER